MARLKKGGYKRFDPSIKLKAVALLRSGRTGTSVAEELGVSYPTIINWKRTMARGDSSSAEPRISRDDELHLLRLENEYLKKQMETKGDLEQLRLKADYLTKKLEVFEGKRRT